MAKKSKACDTDRLPLLELLKKEHTEQSETMRKLQTMLAIPHSSDVWRGIVAVPPGTLLEKILADFRRNTDIPLELPFFCVFALLAGYLLHTGVCLEFRGGVDDDNDAVIVEPDIWLLLLASSGSSKSLTFNKILKATDSRVREATFPLDGIQSAAALFESLKENNKKLAIRDEFNELYKQMRTGAALETVRDMILRIYNHSEITWETKKEGKQQIEDVALCIIGMTVGESFRDSLTSDDLLNGMAQRFLPVIARDDPARPIVRYPLYRFHSGVWKSAWTELVDSIRHKTYIATSDALEGYETTFRTLFTKDLDKSFFRRVMWAAHKYALLYHILCGGGDEQHIGPEAYGWAARALLLHLNDLRELLFSSGLSPLQRVLQKAENLIKKLRAEKRPVTARALVTGIRDIRSVTEARNLLRILSEPEDLTEAEKAKRAKAQA